MNLVGKSLGTNDIWSIKGGAGLWQKPAYLVYWNMRCSQDIGSPGISSVHLVSWLPAAMLDQWNVSWKWCVSYLGRGSEKPMLVSMSLWWHWRRPQILDGAATRWWNLHDYVDGSHFQWPMIDMHHEQEMNLCCVIPLNFRVNESSKKEVARDEAGVVGKGWIKRNLSWAIKDWNFILWAMKDDWKVLPGAWHARSAF